MFIMKNSSTKKFFEIFTLTFLTLGLSILAHAADHYVRAGSFGDGSDWNNALDRLPDTLVRGDTYYLADGSYTGYTFDDAESGTSYITIKKAIESDHGTETGWQTTYGDGQATFDLSVNTAMIFKTGYYILDGQRRTTETSGHGFRVIMDATIDNNEQLIELYGGWLQSAPSHIELKYIEVGATNPQELSNLIGIHINQYWSLWDDNPTQTDLKIQYCYLHNLHYHIQTILADSVLLEHSYLDHSIRDASGPNQQQAIYDISSDNYIIRYNTFKDCCGSATICLRKTIADYTQNPASNYPTAEPDGKWNWSTSNNEEWHEDWEIYGNLFYFTDQVDDALGVDGVIGEVGDNLEDNVAATTKDCKVYNNTFYNLSGQCGIEFRTTHNTGNEVRNNIWYNCDTGGNSANGFWGGGNTTHDYNTFGELLESHSQTEYASSLASTETHGEHLLSDPFTNASNGNFNLSTSTEAGKSLSAPFHIDLNNNLRGADGNWDRGAIEFNNSNISPQAPNAAAGPNQTVTDSQSVILDGSNSSDSDGTIVQWTWQDSLGDIINDGEFVEASLSAGVHTVTLTVTDNDGLTGTDQTVITVNETIVVDQSDIITPSSAWKLTEGTGDTARDSSALQGFDHAQLINSPSWANNGDGLLFNGTNNYLRVADSDNLEILQPATFSMWIKLNGYSSWSKILVKPHSTYASPWEMYAIDLGSGGNTPRFVVTDGIENGAAVAVSANQSINTNQWYHIIGTYDGSSIRLYLDGQLQATQTVDFTIGTNSMPLSIGGRLGVNTIDGNLSDIRIYDECLTTEQVNALYNRKRNNGLTSSLKTTDKTKSDFESSVAIDSSGYNIDGSLINEPLWGDAWAEEYFLLFDGSNQAIEISCESMKAEAGTVALRVEPETTVGHRVLFGHTNSSGNIIQLYTENGVLGVVLGDDTTGRLTNATLQTGLMHHVALSWNGTNYAIYLEGEQEATGTFSGLNALATTADIANVGAAELRTNNFGFEGSIYDVQLYNRALSADEILALANTLEAKENRELSFEVYIEDSTGNRVLYIENESSLPIGAVFDNDTQTFTWKPWYDQAGEYSVQFTSQDGSDQQTITISAQDVSLSDWYRDFLEQNGKL